MASRTGIIAAHRPSARRRRKPGGLKVAVLLLATVATGYAAYKLDVEGYFTIREVTVNRPVYMDQAELDSLCRRLFVGRSILSDLGQPSTKLAAQPLILSVHCFRRFPDKLWIEVVEREPVALANVGELMAVDAEGYVLPLEADKRHLSLPIVTPSSASAVLTQNDGRQRLNREGCRLVQAVTTFRATAPDLLLGISEFTVDESGKIRLVTLEEGVTVVMGRWVEAREVEYYRWMLGEIQRRDDRPALVDLSYEGQIIVKKKYGG